MLFVMSLAATAMLNGHPLATAPSRAAVPQMSAHPPAWARPALGCLMAACVAGFPMDAQAARSDGGYGYGGGGGGAGLYLGLSLAETFLREQQRQAYLQQQLRTQQELGKDQALISQLQQQLAEQNTKVEGLRAQQQGGASTQPQAAPGETEAMLQLKQQVLQQQIELEKLKAASAAK